MGERDYAFVDVSLFGAELTQKFSVPASIDSEECLVREVVLVLVTITDGALMYFALYRELQRLLHHDTIKEIQISAVLLRAKQFFELACVKALRKSSCEEQRLSFGIRYKVTSSIA